MATHARIEQAWAEELPAAANGREATRYLCAAAYGDGAFRKAVLDRRRDPVRANAPEVGVDVEAVGRHCRAAHRSRGVRDALIGIASVALVAALVMSAPSYDDALYLEGPPDDTWFLVPVLIVWGVAAIIVAVHAFSIDGILRRQLTRQAFNDASPAEEPSADCNVVVYSGFSPFVGAGSDIGGWSFAIDLERGREGATAAAPHPFTLAELYDHTTDEFERLRLPNLRISRRLFVSGRCVRNEDRLLPDPYERPVSWLPDGVVDEYADSSSQTVRHYLCVESVDWNGEIAVTFFIRFQKLSSKLFVELSAFLLPPLKPSYYLLDKVRPERRAGDAARLVLLSFVKAPFLLLWAPFATFGRLQAKLAGSSERRQQRTEIDNDLLFDYGATRSIRELATGNEWRVYFQKLDKEMHQKILQQQLLDGLVDFLDKHGIDTSEIKERTTHILNNGLIVSGGTVNADGLAVGQNAQTRINDLARGKREKVKS